MKTRPSKIMLKKVLGEIPLTAELYWQLRQQGKPLSKSFSLHKTQKYLPQWISQAEAARLSTKNVQGKNILMFTTLRYWIEHSTLLGLALSALGHEVNLAYLPVNNWRMRMNRFDLRRQDAYAASILQPAARLLHPFSILGKSGAGLPGFGKYPSLSDVGGSTHSAIRDDRSLPPELFEKIEAVSIRDVQYTLQVEDVVLTSDLYHLRMERNLHTAKTMLQWIQSKRMTGRTHSRTSNYPQVILTPNGSILEMGAVYQVAKYLGIPVVTYEFGEQRGRIWLAQDDEVMLQHTDAMWSAWKDAPLSQSQLGQIRTLYASRQNASLWENFSRRWQGLPSQGGARVRTLLNLDDQRPIVVLAANVIGDSLTLGRQVFSRDMTEWLQRTLRNFAQRPQVQLVVRIHPGERYTKGPSVADVIREGLPDLPDNIRLVGAGDPVNTYDLLEIADLGLVYTTTVGMEMAMSGIPTIVAGQTHYRGKGFTLDPQSWEDYFDLLNSYLPAQSPGDANTKRMYPDVLIRPSASSKATFGLSTVQVDLAWQYAYRFFFDYPLPFPWHLLYFYEELSDWSLERVVSGEGQAQFGETFQNLIGVPRQWRVD